jgi:hypothetical protein
MCRAKSPQYSSISFYSKKFPTRYSGLSYCHVDQAVSSGLAFDAWSPPASKQAAKESRLVAVGAIAPEVLCLLLPVSRRLHGSHRQSHYEISLRANSVSMAQHPHMVRNGERLTRFGGNRQLGAEMFDRGSKQEGMAGLKVINRH